MSGDVFQVASEAAVLLFEPRAASRDGKNITDVTSRDSARPAIANPTTRASSLLLAIIAAVVDDGRRGRLGRSEQC